MKKYFILEIDVPEYCTDCGGATADAVELTTKQFTFQEMLKDVDFRQQLIEEGWADTKAGDGLEDKDLGPRLLLANHYGHHTHVAATIVDPKNQGAISELIQHPNRFLAIEVKEEALVKLNPDADKFLKDALARRAKAKKAAEESAKKRKEAAEAKKVKTEAKKIEEAKKLLLKAGVKVGN